MSALFSDDWNEDEDIGAIRNLPQRQKRTAGVSKTARRAHRQVGKLDSQLAPQADVAASFRFSYTASRHEAQWLVASVGEFYEGQWIDDVLRLVKVGKEANVYQCRANATVQNLPNPYLAAKVYRPPRLRSLKKDHIYREGRSNLGADGNQITNDGMLHAMAKRTEFGRELLHTSWIQHEVKTMDLLRRAGCDVPEAYAAANNAILMGYVGDDASAAPTLSTVQLSKREAARLFERVLHNIELMLAHGRIHADLSAYNILYWEGEITLIDFPQAITPGQNHSSFLIFARDVQRVCDYFMRMGVKASPHNLATQLWRKHQYPLPAEVDPALLDPDDERDRRMWEAR